MSMLNLMANNSKSGYSKSEYVKCSLDSVDVWWKRRGVVKVLGKLVVIFNDCDTIGILDNGSGLTLLTIKEELAFANKNDIRNLLISGGTSAVFITDCQVVEYDDKEALLEHLNAYAPHTSPSPINVCR